jgi:hypothetical protein
MSTFAYLDLPTSFTVQQFHACSFPVRIIHLPQAKQRLTDTVLPPLSERQPYTKCLQMHFSIQTRMQGKHF